MKKLPLILSIIALVGVVALLVLFLIKPAANQSKGDVAEITATNHSDLKIAYVQTDSVLVNYQMALDLHADFVNRQQQYTSDFAAKQKDFEKQAVAFQEKVQRGGFLTEDRAIRERDRILALEEDMKQLDYELTSKLGEMEASINRQLTDSIVNYVKVYNQKHNYSYIFSNNGNIIIGKQQYNITKDILDGLNARYTASKK
ncbi:MAG: OmpH family outer membrane protein [Prolixibacteraceae bacterium]|nr:OmpH family outer membrane protein [Prolixibacteraceae bacterium]